MIVTAFSFVRGDAQVFSGSLAECQAFCKGAGADFYREYTYKGEVVQQKWYNEEENIDYTIN